MIRFNLMSPSFASTIGPRRTQVGFGASGTIIEGALSQTQEDILSKMEEDNPNSVKFHPKGLEVTFESDEQKIAFTTSVNNSNN